MTKKEKKRNASLVLRVDFPYGFIQDISGKIVFFNRNYEALTFGGVKEFEFDPDALGNVYEGKMPARFLMTEDGGSYAGTMYFLYEDVSTPLYFEQKKLIQYLNRFSVVMKNVIGIIGNAHQNDSFTEEQGKETNKKLRIACDIYNNNHGNN